MTNKKQGRNNNEEIRLIQMAAAATASNLTITIFYAIFCIALHLIILSFLSWQKRNNNHTYNTNTNANATTATNTNTTTHLSHRKKVNIANRVVSAIHASIMTCLTTYYWFQQETSFWIGEEKVFIAAEVTPLQALAVELMLGYLIVDTCVEWIYNKDYLTLAHHFAGMISHLITLLENDGSAGAYSMLIYLAESSTPFLHSSWILKEMKADQSIFFYLAILCLLLTFFVFRVLLSPYMLYHMILHWLPTGKAYIFYLNVGLVTIFVGLNYYWFYLLLRLLPIPGLQSKKQRPGKKID